LNGAKALGMANSTGSLTVGKEADITAVDLGQIETQPLYNPISQIVYACGRNQVTDVWIAGRQVLKARELMTIDASAQLAKAALWQEKIREC
jgi:5-methylthioadenosine/S-adenosylhomocysteine deaminase